MSLNQKSIQILFDEMISANKKCKLASIDYNKLDAELTFVEKDDAKRFKGLTEADVKERLRRRKEKDEELKSFYNKYSFWSGEVQRISALLQGIEAYGKLKLMV